MELELEREGGRKDARGWVGWGKYQIWQGFSIQQFKFSNLGVLEMESCKDAFERVCVPAGSHLHCQLFKPHWNPHLDTFSLTHWPPSHIHRPIYNKHKQALLLVSPIRKQIDLVHSFVDMAAMARESGQEMFFYLHGKVLFSFHSLEFIFWL